MSDKYFTDFTQLLDPYQPFPNHAGYISLMIAFWTVLSGPMGDPFGNARLPVSLVLFVFMLCIIRLFYWCCDILFVDMIQNIFLCATYVGIACSMNSEQCFSYIYSYIFLQIAFPQPGLTWTWLRILKTIWRLPTCR